jgi:Zn-dependent peptidase ImmA (M78 family)/nicotinamide mononucleotide adenylyltransferase
MPSNYTSLSSLLKEEESTNPANPAGIVFYPGNFKPPHKGHYASVMELAARAYTIKIIVIISNKTSDNITPEESMAIWDIFLKANPNPKIEIRLSNNKTPIQDIFQAFDGDLNLKAYVGAGAGEADDASYIQALTKAFGKRVMPLYVQEKFLVNGAPISSTYVREVIVRLNQYAAAVRSTQRDTTDFSKARNGYLNTLEEFKNCFPDAVMQKGFFDDIMRVLGIDYISVDELQENTFDISWWKRMLNENEEKEQAIHKFIDFARLELGLKVLPQIELLDDSSMAKDMRSLGGYNPSSNKLLVITNNRLTADILRTIAHELVHRKQDEDNQLNIDSGKTGSPEENEANAMAGVLLRKYGEQHEEIYESLSGVGKGKNLEDIAKHHSVDINVIKQELKKGLNVEMEHTKDKKTALKIAIDHLWENPKYYTKLAKAKL